MGEARSLWRVRPLTAELLVIYFRLKMAWRMNFSAVVLEPDSMEAINLLQGREVGSVEDWALIQNCRELLDRQWVVEIKHIFRQANKVSDWLAKWAMRQGIGVSEMG